MPSDSSDYNYGVLKLHDSALDKIIFRSSICDVYEFNNTSENWNQIDCKGTVFLYSRISNDGFPYALLVLNRNSPMDFYVGITPAFKSVINGKPPMETELQDSTIMVQKSVEQIYGLWLFEESDRPKLTSLIRWCITNGTAWNWSMCQFIIL